MTVNSKMKKTVRDRFNNFCSPNYPTSVDNFVSHGGSTATPISLHLSIGSHFRNKGENRPRYSDHQNLASIALRLPLTRLFLLKWTLELGSGLPQCRFARPLQRRYLQQLMAIRELRPLVPQSS